MGDKRDFYIQAFSTLRTDTNKKRWLARTNFKAPHKPFLLLSILDLIDSESLTRNFIEPSFELAETFTGYWSKIMPLGSSASMSYPFYHLESSGFWHLVGQLGVFHKHGYPISSVKRLRELYLGARFDEDLFLLLLMKDFREEVREMLVMKYFAQEVRSIITEQTSINYDASRYSQVLLNAAESLPDYSTAEKPAKINQARNQGFRKAIVQLYEHRCALCGIRMLTPEGHTIVEAAHIVPWCESKNDKPQNGLALCRLCHWSFDEGLMGVGKDFEVLVSLSVRQDNNFPGHMETLSGRGIFKPHDRKYWPDQSNFAIHRKNTFRRR
jgi:putative restriction endonuclease